MARLMVDDALSLYRLWLLLLLMVVFVYVCHIILVT